MSIDKHTPGPWEVVKKSTDRKMRPYFDIHMKGLSGIVASIPSFAVVNLEESCANAELISMAPSLLAENKELKSENEFLHAYSLKMRDYEYPALEAENKRLREKNAEISENYDQADFFWKEASKEIERVNELLAKIMKLAGHHIGQSIQEEVEAHLAKYNAIDPEITPAWEI